MRHSPGFFRRLTLLSLQNDLVRGAIALCVLVALMLADAPIWIALSIPMVTYLGFRLLIPTVPANSTVGTGTSSRRLGRSNQLDDVRRARESIGGAAAQMPDPDGANQARAVAGWIDRSLEVIQEDGKTETLVPLLELANFTNDLLARYLKLCRRGLADSGMHAQMKQSLAIIEERFKWFWEQLNRDAIVDLTALSAAIELFMATVPTAFDVEGKADAPALLPAGVSEDNPAHGRSQESARAAGLIATLTAREMDVLCHVVEGQTNQQIADSLFISRHTVAKHVENFCGKLEVQNRTEAAAFAIRNDLC